MSHWDRHSVGVGGTFTMAKRVPGRIGLWTCTGIVAASAALAAGCGASAVASQRQVDGQVSVVKQRQIALGSCRRPTVRLRVALARTTYLPTQAVNLVASLRNVGTKSCTF